MMCVDPQIAGAVTMLVPFLTFSIGLLIGLHR